MGSYLDAILSGLLMGLSITISLGPGNLLMIRYALEKSFKQCVFYSLGLQSIDAVYFIIISNYNLNTFQIDDRILHSVSIIIFSILGWVGWRAKPKESKAEISSNEKSTSLFWHGFIISAINPFIPFIWISTSLSIKHHFVLFGVVALVTVVAGDIGKIILFQRIKESKGVNFIRSKEKFLWLAFCGYQVIRSAYILLFG